MDDENFDWFVRLEERDIEHVESVIGKKTINQLRHEHGLMMISGGDMPYTDWLRQQMGYPIPTIH